METFPQHWAHSELFTMLMGWALDLLSFVVCSVLGFSCYSEAKVARLTMLRCIIFSPNILWLPR